MTHATKIVILAIPSYQLAINIIPPLPTPPPTSYIMRAGVGEATFRSVPNAGCSGGSGALRFGSLALCTDQLALLDELLRVVANGQFSQCSRTTATTTPTSSASSSVTSSPTTTASSTATTTVTTSMSTTQPSTASSTPSATATTTETSTATTGYPDRFSCVDDGTDKLLGQSQTLGSCSVQATMLQDMLTLCIGTQIPGSALTLSSTPTISCEALAGSGSGSAVFRVSDSAACPLAAAGLSLIAARIGLRTPRVDFQCGFGGFLLVSGSDNGCAPVIDELNKGVRWHLDVGKSNSLCSMVRTTATSTATSTPSTTATSSQSTTATKSSTGTSSTSFLVQPEDAAAIIIACVSALTLTMTPGIILSVRERHHFDSVRRASRFGCRGCRRGGRRGGRGWRRGTPTAARCRPEWQCCPWPCSPRARFVTPSRLSGPACSTQSVAAPSCRLFDAAGSEGMAVLASGALGARTSACNPLHLWQRCRRRHWIIMQFGSWQ